MQTLVEDVIAVAKAVAEPKHPRRAELGSQCGYRRNTMDLTGRMRLCRSAFGPYAIVDCDEWAYPYVCLSVLPQLDGIC